MATDLVARVAGVVSTEVRSREQDVVERDGDRQEQAAGDGKRLGGNPAPEDEGDGGRDHDAGAKREAERERAANDEADERRAWNGHPPGRRIRPLRARGSRDRGSARRAAAGPEADCDGEQHEARDRGQDLDQVDRALWSELEAGRFAPWLDRPGVCIAVEGNWRPESSAVAPGAPAAVVTLAEHEPGGRVHVELDVVAFAAASTPRVPRHTRRRRGARDRSRGRRREQHLVGAERPRRDPHPLASGWQGELRAAVRGQWLAGVEVTNAPFHAHGNRLATTGDDDSAATADASAAPRVNRRESRDAQLRDPDGHGARIRDGQDAQRQDPRANRLSKQNAPTAHGQRP